MAKKDKNLQKVTARLTELSRGSRSSRAGRTGTSMPRASKPCSRNSPRRSRRLNCARFSKSFTPPSPANFVFPKHVSNTRERSMRERQPPSPRIFPRSTIVRLFPLRRKIPRFSAGSVSKSATTFTMPRSRERLPAFVPPSLPRKIFCPFNKKKLKRNHNYESDS